MYAFVPSGRTRSASPGTSGSGILYSPAGSGCARSAVVAVSFSGCFMGGLLFVQQRATPGRSGTHMVHKKTGRGQIPAGRPGTQRWRICLVIGMLRDEEKPGGMVPKLPYKQEVGGSNPSAP